VDGERQSLTGFDEALGRVQQLSKSRRRSQ